MRLFSLIFFLMIGLFVSAQSPAGLPSPKTNAYYEVGFMRGDSGMIFPKRDTFNAKYPTLILHNNGKFYYTQGSSTSWFEITSSSIHRIFAGYGLLNANDSTLQADSAVLANYFLRRSDSSYYVTQKNLKDSGSAYRGLVTTEAATARAAENLKLNYSDTAAMLLGYKNAINKNTDSITAHNIRIGANTSNIITNTANIALKVNYTDSSNIYQAKFRSDTARVNFYKSLGAKADTARLILDSTVLANLANGKTTISVVDSLYQPLDKSLYQMGNYYNKLYAQYSGVAQAKWLSWGDSYATKIYSTVANVLRNQSGGNISGTFFPAPYNGVTINGTTGSVTDSTNDFKTWVSGLTTTLTSGGSRTYGVSGGTFNANKITVLYVLEPSAGTLKLQVNGVDASGFTNVSCVGTLGNLGIATIRQTTQQSNVSIVNLTGITRVIGVGFEDTTINGLTTINVSQGGIAIGGQTNSATTYPTELTNFNQFLVYLKPDVFTHEMKEASSYYKQALTTFYSAINTSLLNTDIVLIGSTPLALNDADQVLQNTILRNFADSIGYKYYDTYRLFGSYAKLVQLGWQGDGTHVISTADQFRGMHMLNDMGITNIDFKRNFASNVLNDTTQTSFLKVKLTGIGNYDVFKVIPSSQDAIVTGYRLLQFKDTSGVVQMQIVASGGNLPIIPNNSQIGSGNAYLNGANNYVWFKKFGGNSHVVASTVSLTTNSQTISSGNLVVNTDNAAFQTINLTGNIGQVSFTSFAFSEHFILKIVQDATGGRTIGSWSPAIKFTGGIPPVLSTSANAVDIIEFTTDGSGATYEVSRNIQDKSYYLPNVLTTTGDIIYSSSGSTAARLPIGATNSILTVSGGIPAYTLTPTLTSLTTTGALTGNTIVKTGGTSSQFLKADGSVDANAYVSNPLISSSFEIRNGSLYLSNGTYGVNLSIPSLTANRTATYQDKTGTVAFLQGTTTNDNAAAGNIGENVESEINTATNYTTTATYQNVTSITLTAGDWDLSAIGTFNANTATITAAANAIFVVSTTTASATGATAKNTMFIPQAALLGTSAQSSSSANYRVSIASTTTFFLNTQATFTLGNPQFTGFIRARRMR